MTTSMFCEIPQDLFVRQARQRFGRPTGLRARMQKAETIDDLPKLRVMASQEPAMLLNDYGLIACWNDAAEKLFGWTRREALGRHVADLLLPSSQINSFVHAMADWYEQRSHANRGGSFYVNAVTRSGDQLNLEVLARRQPATAAPDRFEILLFVPEAPVQEIEWELETSAA